MQNCSTFCRRFEHHLPDLVREAKTLGGWVLDASGLLEQVLDTGVLGDGVDVGAVALVTAG